MTTVSVAPTYVNRHDKVAEDNAHTAKANAAMMGINYCPKHIGTWISKPRKYLGNPKVRDCPDCTRNYMRYVANKSILEMTEINDESSPLGTEDSINFSNKTDQFVPPVLPDPKRKSEELLKKGDKLRTNWEKRHFVLEKGTLTYYKGKNHVNHPRGHGAQDLESYYYQDLPDDHGIEDFKKRIFLKSVDPSKPTFYLEAKNETHRNNWLIALDENIDYAEKMHEFKVMSETFSVDELLERTSLVAKNGVRRVSKSISLRRASIVDKLGFILHENEEVLYDGILGKISYRQVKGTPDEVQRHVYLTSLPRLIYVNPQDRSDHHSIDLNDLPVIYLHGVEDDNKNWFTLQMQEDGDAKIMHFYPRDMTLAKIWVEKCLECGLCAEHTSGVVEIRKPLLQGMPLWKTAFKNLVTGVDPHTKKMQFKK